MDIEQIFPKIEDLELEDAETDVVFDEKRPDVVVVDENDKTAARIGMRLTPKQRLYAERYLQHFDRLRAIEEVYDIGNSKSVYTMALRMDNHPTVQQYIAMRIAEKGLAANHVLARLAEIATGSLEDFLNDEMLEAGHAMVDLRKAKDLGKLHLLKRIRYLEKGGVEIELHDQMRALELLAKHLGLLQQEEVKIDNYTITVVRE